VQPGVELSTFSYLINTRAPVAYMTDIELYTAIQAGGSARLSALEAIYHWDKLRQKVISYVLQHGGNRIDGKDVFHDGIVALDQNIRNRRYQPGPAMEGYLFTICRYLWNNEARRRRHFSQEDITDQHVPPNDETPEVLMRTKEQAAVLTAVLELLDAGCRQLLTLWKLSYTMTEIATALQLSSPELAKKYRYRCMQKLMDQLSNHPHLVNSLKDG
jgi:RNA polymerase sigma factor (sigma-70 family)